MAIDNITDSVTNFTVTPIKGTVGFFTVMNTWLQEHTGVMTSLNTVLDAVNVMIGQTNSAAENINTKEETVVAKEALMSPHYDDIDLVSDNLDIDGVSGKVQIVSDNLNPDGVSGKVQIVSDNINAVMQVEDNIDDVTNYAQTYLGGKTSIPTLRNDGTALQASDLFHNKVDADPLNWFMSVYNGVSWGIGYAGDFYTRGEIEAGDAIINSTILTNVLIADNTNRAIINPTTIASITIGSGSTLKLI